MEKSGKTAKPGKQVSFSLVSLAEEGICSPLNYLDDVFYSANTYLLSESKKAYKVNGRADGMKLRYACPLTRFFLHK